MTVKIHLLLTLILLGSHFITHATTSSTASATVTSGNFVNADSTGQVGRNGGGSLNFRAYAAFRVSDILANEGIGVAEIATSTFEFQFDTATGTQLAAGSFRADFVGFFQNGDFPNSGAGNGVADWDLANNAYNTGEEIDSSTADTSASQNIIIGGFTFSGVSDDGDLTNDYIVIGIRYNEPQQAGLDETLSNYTLTRIVAPVAVADSITMYRHGKADINVLANDATGELSTLTTSITSPPTHGTATPKPDGSILYTYTGTGNPTQDTFTYNVSNSSGSSSATVTITFANSLTRFDNQTLNFPNEPPPVSTNFTLVDAFPGLVFETGSATPSVRPGPVDLVNAPGDTQRLFVCEKSGVLRVIPDVTSTSPSIQTFLDIKSLVNARANESMFAGGESGLTSCAFHPQYQSNGRFFVHYDYRNESNGNRYYRLSEFKVSSSNPNQADPNSEIIHLELLEDATGHLGSDIQFGPDGYLYLSFGDNGDQHDAGANSQLLDHDFWTNLLRIDVDKKAGNLEPHPPGTNSNIIIPLDNQGKARYSIPVDNPYIPGQAGSIFDMVGSVEYWNAVAITNDNSVNPRIIPVEVRTEIWATGFRNPWKFTFHPTNGTLLLGDTSQDTWEEINLITRGGNYGWAFREGSVTHTPAGNRPEPTTLTNLQTTPYYQYAHPPGTFTAAVIGGVYYTAGNYSALQNKYIFADIQMSKIYALTDNGVGVAPTVEELTSAEPRVVGFGHDPSNGDILVVNFATGKIMRLVPSSTAPTGENFPTTLSATGIYADLTDLSPNPGIEPYGVNLRFWSDHAKKTRWFSIPSKTDTIGYDRDSFWTLPNHAVWVKHFDLPLARETGVDGVIRNVSGASTKRLETRVLVKSSTGFYGVSYRWNDQGTEATLVPDTGESFDVSITLDGSPTTHTWSIPSRTDCLACHVATAGSALSFNTRQLNRNGTSLGGTDGNYLWMLFHAGYLNNNPGSTNIIPKYVRPDETDYSVTTRVRSWLDVNCAYCHRFGGASGRDTWDGRHPLTLAQTQMINGHSTANSGNPLERLIVPGSPNLSVIYNRAGALNNFSRMPPLGSEIVDQEALNLLLEWINNTLPNQPDYDQWRITHFGDNTDPAGAPNADPDSDGATNEHEFNTLTNPLSVTSVWRPSMSMTSGHLTLSHSINNRSVILESSQDLNTWSAYDITGNDGTPKASGNHSFVIPLDDINSRTFFRYKVNPE